MEMMPIMNVFNEWHAANTSKKIRAVLKANAREGKYHARKAPYGYVKSDTEKKTPVIDEEAAAVVKRIFEMRASGLSPHKIADILNAEGILNPSRYSVEKYGIVGRKENMGLWSFCAVNSILNNPTYLGHMAQQRWSSVSYKNHKRYKRDESEWVMPVTAPLPIVSIADRKSANSEGMTHTKVHSAAYCSSEKKIPSQNSLPLTNKFDWVSRGGVVPSKSEPNSALISSIVAVFEPSL